MKKKIGVLLLILATLMMIFAVKSASKDDPELESAVIPGMVETEAAEPAMRTWTIEKSGAGEALVKVMPYVKPTEPEMVQTTKEPEIFEDFFNEDHTAFALKRYLDFVGMTEAEVHSIYGEPVWMGVFLPSGDEVQITLEGKMTMPQVIVNRTDERTYRADLMREGELILVDDVHEKYVYEDQLWLLAETVERLARVSKGCPFVEIGVTHWEYPTYDVRVQSLHQD